jgi:hypothetical protein
MSRCDFCGQKKSCRQINIYSKQVDVILAGKIIMLPNYHLLKTSRCNFGGQKKSGNICRCMKSEESMAGKDSKLARTCSKLMATNFTIKKNEIPI